MKPVVICVLAKYNDIFSGFLHMASLYAPDVPKALVRDGVEIPWPEGWQHVQGPAKFSMAGNGNLALRAASTGHDVLYCGDDIRFLETDTVQRLQDEAYSDARIGILSPKLIGRSGPMQANPPAGISDVPPEHFCFPCVYIKRAVLDTVGYLDETFSEYGCDDNDLCIRILLAGFRIVVTSRVSVVHQESADHGASTFNRVIGEAERGRQNGAALQKLKDKWKGIYNIPW